MEPIFLCQRASLGAGFIFATHPLAPLKDEVSGDSVMRPRRALGLSAGCGATLPFLIRPVTGMPTRRGASAPSWPVSSELAIGQLSCNRIRSPCTSRASRAVNPARGPPQLAQIGRSSIERDIGNTG